MNIGEDFGINNFLTSNGMYATIKSADANYSKLNLYKDSVENYYIIEFAGDQEYDGAKKLLVLSSQDNGGIGFLASMNRGLTDEGIWYRFWLLPIWNKRAFIIQSHWDHTKNSIALGLPSLGDSDANVYFNAVQEGNEYAIFTFNAS